MFLQFIIDRRTSFIHWKWGSVSAGGLETLFSVTSCNVLIAYTLNFISCLNEVRKLTIMETLVRIGLQRYLVLT